MSDFVAAECGIRQLQARMVDAVWRKDAVDFAACFAPDGEWKIAGMLMRGRDEIRDTFTVLLGVCKRVQIVASPPLLDVGAGVATGRVNMTEFAKMMDDSSAMILGVYRGPIDLSAPIVESPHYGRFPDLPPADEPTATRCTVD